MSENLKTIKELADELGITKQTVQYHIKNLPSKIRNKNSRGAILLTKEEQNFIKSRVNKQSDREQSDREQSDREQSDREQSDREQSDREQSDREQSDREQSDREQSDREQSDREQSDREQSDREQSDREQSDREQFYLEKIKIQEEQIEDFKEQRIELREQVKHLGVLLDQQQHLALQDKKLLEEYKAENDSLKALKIPAEGSQAEQPGNQPQAELEALKSEIKALNDKIKGQEELNNQVSKKWYQFWK
ncbi:LuxR C-terminal-related transcriptional regulator [Lactococcus garvieae]|uniref:LuxR C-terminal-related transcriptional regulator n=1 Tax=Lactococcus garvieae TaxID=1363 RepID=UPI001BD051BB|nr:LuxR C-terminal-related transcriptional regulator [Lactococcus garvieae]MBS4465013.1 helix-turn-helix domain-containing protein [Lactococcus garvieae]